MDPVVLAAGGTFGGLVLDKLLMFATRCFLTRRNRNRALVCILGKTELCKSLYHLSDDHFQIVDVEGETMNSLKDETKLTLAELEKVGNFAQRNRLFNLYAKTYILMLKKNFPRARFLFVTSTHAMAKFACGIPSRDIQTSIPSARFSEVLAADMTQLDKSDFDTKKIEAVRRAGGKNTNIFVFDTWDALTKSIMGQYNLSQRL